MVPTFICEWWHVLPFVKSFHPCFSRMLKVSHFRQVYTSQSLVFPRSERFRSEFQSFITFLEIVRVSLYQRDYLRQSQVNIRVMRDLDTCYWTTEGPVRRYWDPTPERTLWDFLSLTGSSSSSVSEVDSYPREREVHSVETPHEIRQRVSRGRSDSGSTGVTIGQGRTGTELRSKRRTTRVLVEGLCY